ncbi:MAG: alpha-L-fucosidase, partial [Acidobacteria bacterium]|nr:alpha-L-fucosidase [Acidobacteriota bacterium]
MRLRTALVFALAAAAGVAARAGLKACVTCGGDRISVAQPLRAAAVTSVAQPLRAAVDPAREKRLEWFREAKYGLFIHWGLYAIPAGEWKGQRSLGLGEWIMFRSRIPVREYETLASRFNPVKYKAD